MAVVKMKLVSIIGKMDELDNVIEQSCSDGNFQLDQAMTFFSNSSGFTPLNEDNPYSSLFSALKETLSAANLKKVDKVDDDILMDKSEIQPYVSDFCSKINKLQSEKQSILISIDEEKHAKSQFEHFLGLDLKISELLSCEFIKVRFGRLPKESYEKLKSYTDNPYIIYFPCTNDAQYVWGVYFSPIEEIAETDRIFASLYFERLKIPRAVGTPDEAIVEIKKKIDSLENRLNELDKEISSIWETESYKCSKLYNYLKQHRNAFDLRRYAARYNDSFILAGWLPVTHESEFKAKLDKIDGIEYKIDDASNEPLHAPPVKLKNFKAFKPFEYFVDMYGLPSYNEVDPTPFVAITYFLIFGMMFADLGQGIVLSLIGWLFMWKMKKMPLGKIIGLCGISSAFFGFILGSFFGFEHVLDPIWGKIGSWFGVTFEHGKPIEVMQSTMEVIYASVVFGVLLLVIAMLINIYSCVKRKDYGNAFFGPNGAAGLVFYCSLLFGLVGQMFLGMNILTPIYIIFLIVLPLLVLCFYEPLCHLVEGRKNWLPQKWGEYLTQTFFEVFEYLLSYVSNTLSFMRIGAFVFVHAGMMEAVMMLAGVEEGGALTAGSIVVLIIGNIIVMGMEALLVAIQSLRLEFYEIFSRFFSGNGKPFRPINIKKTSSIK